MTLQSISRLAAAQRLHTTTELAESMELIETQIGIRKYNYFAEILSSSPKFSKGLKSYLADSRVISSTEGVQLPGPLTVKPLDTPETEVPRVILALGNQRNSLLTRFCIEPPLGLSLKSQFQRLTRAVNGYRLYAWSVLAYKPFNL